MNQAQSETIASQKSGSQSCAAPPSLPRQTTEIPLEMHLPEV